jgi:beta-glucosidase
MFFGKSSILKRIFVLIPVIVSGVFFVACQHQTEKVYRFPFQNPGIPVEQRVDDLLHRLTLEEKASLMLYNSPAVDRLDIPAYNWWNECLHGVARAGRATVFPQAIGMAATFDDDLIYRVAVAISDEARAKYNIAVKDGETGQYSGLTFWSPNINIFRDPRWGRGQETYGEDPFLTGTMGAAFVRGLQGEKAGYLKVSACAKHFAVHSGPEKSRHFFNAHPSERDFRETYLPAFKMLVDAGVESVMCAYNRLDGEPCCANAHLLDTVLRKEWGFNGHIVTDCWAPDDIWFRHKTAPDRVTTAAMVARAGVSLNCGYIYGYLPAAVDSGYIDDNIVDANLKRLLITRFKLGLFDPVESVPYGNIPAGVIDSKQHRKLALETARKSIVLLKNNGVLPLNTDSVNSVLLTGPFAADINILAGNYNGYSSGMTTILEGFVNRAKPSVKINYKQGFVLGNDSVFNGFWDARQADVVVACVGLSPLLEGENGDAMLNDRGGDRQKIELPENQVRFIKKMRETVKDKPLVLIVTGGSAIALGEVATLADAVIFAWYPGEEGGNAVADVVFGNVNPSGKLPVTFYRATSDLPPFDSYDMKGRTYKYFNASPLYPFGFGLSYTDFHYDSIRMSGRNFAPDDTVEFTVSVSNTGDYDGEEVVQVYVSKQQRAKDDPLKTLVGFKRLSIAKGGKKEAIFSIPVSAFGSWNISKQKFITAAGKYILSVGTNSSDTPLKVVIKIL